MRTADILIVEDTPTLRMVFESALTRAGHRVEAAATGAEAEAAFERLRPDVVLMDIHLPDGNGIELTRRFLAIDPDARVIVITADGSVRRAVEAMRAGAQEFLVKPFDDARLIAAVTNALAAGPGHSRPPAETAAAPDDGMLGTSSAMAAVRARIASVARSMATVFITGESGTGKELAAQAIHRASPRAAGPFVALNCGAIPGDLLESEVFGHLRGAFTGAVADKPGAAALADGGTLFLDEVCEMDLALQTKLLRFLQTATIHPVGAPRPRKVDVRILCATNRDPQRAVRAGRFREDLYYRLHVVPLHMPALRDRGEDAVEIAAALLPAFAAEEGKAFTGLSDDVTALFRGHRWPGNVRQLLNALRNVVVLNDGPVVTRTMLPADLLADGAEGAAPVAGLAPGAVQPQLDGLGPLVGRTLAEVEQIVIEETIARCGGSVPQAARVLDVAPSTLYRKRDAWARDGLREAAQ